MEKQPDITSQCLELAKTYSQPSQIFNEAKAIQAFITKRMDEQRRSRPQYLGESGL